MPRNLKPDDVIKEYTITKELNKGTNAISFAAQSSSGEKVFLKQYKSPGIRVSWRQDFIDYQQLIKKRLESSFARNFTYRLIEFFEAKRCYFQVFEFIENGASLAEFFNDAVENPSCLSWNKRMIFGKVMMAAINALSEADIIHSDLKPENIVLIPDSEIKVGYRLRIADLDFSLLEDKTAPWDGHIGYVGTPGWMSPEHLSGKVPQKASDVFTCGLILYKLLAQGHPYIESEDAKEIKEAIFKYSAPKPQLQGSVTSPADADEIQDTIYHCLDPNPANRPTAKEVNLALNGMLKKKPAPSRPVDPPLKPASSRVSGGARLKLTAESGKAMAIGTDTAFSKYLMKKFGEDGKYYDRQQFTIVKKGDTWYVEPNADATNDTMLNGKKLVSRTALKHDDRLAVGRESKGIEKLPLIVSFMD